MSATGAPGGARAAWARTGWNVERPTAGRVIVIGGVLLFVLLALPALLSAYWINVLTGVAVFAVVALGLNLLFGRVGLVSLGQIALLAVASLDRGPALLPDEPAVPDRAPARGSCSPRSSAPCSACLHFASAVSISR